MATINDFIKYYYLERYKKYFQALSTDPLVTNKLAELDDTQVEERVKFLIHDLDEILNRLKNTPTDEDMQSIVRAALCAGSCYNVARTLLTSNRSKTEWTVETVISILSREQNAQSDLQSIIHVIGYYNGSIGYNPELVTFFLTFSNDELCYLRACEELLRSPYSLEKLKQLSQEILQGKPLCDWYEGELAKAEENNDPSVIKQLLSSQAFQEYSALKYKKPAPSIQEFVIKHDFMELIEGLVDAGTISLADALNAAIKNKKPLLVQKLCDKGALKTAKEVLYTAYQKDNPEIFAMLVKAGADVNEENLLRSVLGAHLAGRNRSKGKIYLDMLMTLLETRKCNIVGRELHDTVLFDNVEILNLLIKFGALSQRNEGSEPLLRVALEHDSLDVIPTLLAAGQSLDQMYEEKTIWDMVANYKMSSTPHETEQYRDYEKELPFIREALRMALVECAASKDPNTNLRERVKSIYDKNMAAKTAQEHTRVVRYTLLSNYKRQKAWGILAPDAMSWCEGDEPKALYQTLTNLMNKDVNIAYISGNKNCEEERVNLLVSEKGQGWIKIKGWGWSSEIDINSIISVRPWRTPEYKNS